MNDSIQSQSFIAAIGDDDQIAIAKWYHWYREKLLPHAQRQFSNVPIEAVEDAFHDALMVFVEKVESGKFYLDKTGAIQGLKKGSVKAFIQFVLKCNLIRWWEWRKKNPTISPDEYRLRHEQTIDHFDPFGEELSMDARRVHKAFEDLKEMCQDILKGKLLNGFSHETLAEWLGDKYNLSKVPGKRTLRVQKHRCLQQLRKNYHQLIGG